MISAHDQFDFDAAGHAGSVQTVEVTAELQAIVDRNNRRFVRTLARRFGARPALLKPSEWLESTGPDGRPLIILDIPAARKKAWSFEGREYLRDQIDDVDNPAVRKITTCGGTGSGKTTRDLGIQLHEFRHNPFPGLYIMPALKGPGGATSICRDVIATLEASPAFVGLLPQGAARKTDLTSARIEFAGNDLDFVGASSANQVGNKRCRVVFLGEQDKLKESLGREAGTDYLASERTKGMANTKIIRGSTPSLEGFGIWPHLMGNGDSTGSDCRRRFLPCPHCNPAASGLSADAGAFKGWFILIKDEKYNTALPTKSPQGSALPFAPLRWDKEAKRRDGTWDMDRVVRSARFECPHCGGHVRDDHRLWLDKHGIWIPTRRGELGHHGYQLSSFYAPMVRDEFGSLDFNSTWGGIAQKFLNALERGEMGGYVNSDLAEVNTNQQTAIKIELSSAPVSQPDWVSVVTSDFHKNWPLVWFVVRRWCAFKLLPPLPMTGGIPDFAADLTQSGNEAALELCRALLDVKGDDFVRQSLPGWQVIAELQRFDSRTGKSPLIDFLLGQKIVGDKLVRFFHESAHGNTLDFRKLIFTEMNRIDPAIPARPPRGGDSELVAAGYCETSGRFVFDELQEIAQEFEAGKGMAIPNHCIAMDCGFAEKFNRAVLQECYERAQNFKYYDATQSARHAHIFFSERRHNFCLPASADGWLPVRGKPTMRPLGGGRLNPDLYLSVEDPFYGTPKAGQSVIEVLDIPSGMFWLRKEDLRQGRSKQLYGISPRVQWFPKVRQADGTVTNESNFKLADYERHVNEQFFDERRGLVMPRHGKGGSQNRAHPYHLDDCEVYQIALATHNEFFEESGHKPEGK